eukprot:1412005-Alexandrium_andersonii.AAC.1
MSWSGVPHPKGPPVQSSESQGASTPPRDHLNPPSAPSWDSPQNPIRTRREQIAQITAIGNFGNPC